MLAALFQFVRPRGIRATAAALLVTTLALLTGCQQPMRTPYAQLNQGDYAAARLSVRDDVVNNRRDRRYLLDRMRLGVLTLADGYPRAAATVFEEVYDVLRTQGINADKTVASVVLNEDIKLWKGEPFEQALALAYYALVQAELGSWDNARAASDNALFYLRDFGEDETGHRLNTQEIAERSLRYERAVAAGLSPEAALRQADGLDLDHGYVVQPSNFTLGYLLHAIANQQLDRPDEASDHFRQAVRIAPALAPLVETMRRGQYNTVLVVSWGLGPEKRGYGPDAALARFVPRYPSDRGELLAQVAGQEVGSYPQVLDVNAMASDHMWNNLEDVRIAKSNLGTALLYGGAITASIGHNHDSDTAMYAGLGAAAAGLFLKAGAHVDIRYADVMPQRFYVVPLTITEPNTRVMLQVEGEPSSRLVLAGLAPPRGPDAQLRYVRLVSQPHPGAPAPAWATSGEIFYSNPHTGAAPGPQLPYILGGRSVQPPDEDVLDSYQRWGYLADMTVAELREFYRLEGIQLTIEDQAGYAGAHVLEGGDSLVAPLPGTTGFARLFGQLHPPYRPRTRTVAEAAEHARQQAPPSAAIVGRGRRE